MPEQFWKMTLYELTLCLEAYNEKLNQEIELMQNILAWHAANIINGIPFRKRAVKPTQLLGKKQPNFTSKEDFKEFMRQRLNN